MSFLIFMCGEHKALNRFVYEFSPASPGCTVRSDNEILYISLAVKYHFTYLICMYGMEYSSEASTMYSTLPTHTQLREFASCGMPWARQNVRIFHARALCVWVFDIWHPFVEISPLCEDDTFTEGKGAHVLRMFCFFFPFALDILHNFGWCFIQNHFWLHCVGCEFLVYCKTSSVWNSILMIFMWVRVMFAR